MNIFLDADVLFKKNLIIFLLWLEDCGGPQIYTSETTWNEAIKNRMVDYPNFRSKDKSTFDAAWNFLNNNGRIIQKTEYIDSPIDCGNTDPKDAHNVKAANTFEFIDSIITFNITDYDTTHIQKAFKIKVEECDNFLTSYNTTHNKNIECVIDKLISTYNNPLITRDDILLKWHKCGCVKLSLALKGI